MPKKMSANAVVGADFETSGILRRKAAVFAAYGTAVIAKPVENKK